MRPKEDLHGVRFGSWTVVMPSGHQRGQPAWLVECRCGARRRMVGSDIRRAVRNDAKCRCSQCQAHRSDAPLSYDYASPEGLMMQGLICGRFRTS